MIMRERLYIHTVKYNFRQAGRQVCVPLSSLFLQYLRRILTERSQMIKKSEHREKSTTAKPQLIVNVPWVGLERGL